MKREWEEAHRVTEELVEGPPSRRANATFTASPDGVSVSDLRTSVEILTGTRRLELCVGDRRGVLQ